jgi:hypothetical protein
MHLAIVWALCAAGGFAAAWMLMQVALHPLNDTRPLTTWVVIVLPYLLLGVTGWLWSGSRRALLLLGVVTVFTVFLGTVACIGHWESTIIRLDARARGATSRNCGPPPFVCQLPLMYGMAILAGLTGLGRKLEPYLEEPAEAARKGMALHWREVSLSALGLSPPVHLWAERQGIKTVGQLCHLTEEEARAREGFTEAISLDLREKLTRVGLQFRPGDSSGSHTE